MPAILFCGDPHGGFGHIIQAVIEKQPTATIILGDITPKEPLHIELASILDLTDLWWIPGNHDTDDERYYDNLFGSELADRNLHCRVVDIAGLRVAGLGGVFREKIWMPGRTDPSYDSPEEYLARCGKGNRWRGGLPLRHRSTIFPHDLEYFEEHSADIFVTHEAPELHRFGNSAISELASKLGVWQAFHGHHHEDISYPGSIWHQVGLRKVYSLTL